MKIVKNLQTFLLIQGILADNERFLSLSDQEISLERNYDGAADLQPQDGHHNVNYRRLVNNQQEKNLENQNDNQEQIQSSNQQKSQDQNQNSESPSNKKDNSDDLISDQERVITSNMGDIVSASQDCDAAQDIGACYKEKQKSKGQDYVLFIFAGASVLLCVIYVAMALHKYYQEKKSNQDPKQEVDRLQRDYEKFKKLKMMELEALERQKALKDQKRSMNASSQKSKKQKSKKNKSQNSSTMGAPKTTTNQSNEAQVGRENDKFLQQNQQQNMQQFSPEVLQAAMMQIQTQQQALQIILAAQQLQQQTGANVNNQANINLSSQQQLQVHRQLQLLASQIVTTNGNNMMNGQNTNQAISGLFQPNINFNIPAAFDQQVQEKKRENDMLNVNDINLNVPKE